MTTDAERAELLHLLFRERGFSMHLLPAVSPDDVAAIHRGPLANLTDDEYQRLAAAGFGLSVDADGETLVAKLTLGQFPMPPSTEA